MDSELTDENELDNGTDPHSSLCCRGCVPFCCLLICIASAFPLCIVVDASPLSYQLICTAFDFPLCVVVDAPPSDTY